MPTRGIRHMRKYGYSMVITLTSALSGCGSMPHQTKLDKPDQHAYWNDPKWQASLLNAVQSAVHAPASVPSASTPGIHGTVEFLFANGTVQNPVIVTSTGNPDYDKLMLQQVATANVPAPIGPHANESHEFELPLDMPTPFEAFQSEVYAAIDYRKLYPREGLLGGSTGTTTVDFDYLDAKVSNIKITKSSGDRPLDNASVTAISNALLPTPPSFDVGKTLHIQVLLCYSLNNTNSCPSGKNVIYVTGTRYVRRGGSWYPG
jgi:outer membrane biosynthesis protein TonB